ncbi:glycerol kinase GlpK [Enemella sp. A6]|uniref:glycerol kinase GlpK n=1 Tax=Enemella sp. A6 TaxID=3440152 RepID=UPI003EBD66E7
MAGHLIAVDQGTTSTRAIVYDSSGTPVASDQIELTQRFPRPGWVEHDPLEIWAHTREVIGAAMGKAGINTSAVAGVGITNQRETTVVWDKATGEPIHPAIVWQDTRTSALCAELAGEHGQDRFRDKTGLPIATYFSGPKLRWILDEVPDARARAEAGELLFGTIDTWLAWNLTGGTNGGRHLTDVTNASRTMLMDVRSQQWDDELLDALAIPRAMLPEICSSSQVVAECTATGMLHGVPLAGMLGDQHAATFGQTCFAPGEAKNTYGTGNFMVLNTGEFVPSEHGLISTICYRIGEQPAVFGLEGSIAVTGSLVQWLRDNLGLIRTSSEVEELAASVDDNGGAYLVPAFSGLFAPHWRPDARGVLVGLTRYVNKGHIARAALEASAYQTREVLDAMYADSGVELTELRVDGGMVVNDLLMQFQADLVDRPVVRPKIIETTALGAAYAAGLAVGTWASTDELRELWAEDTRWTPQMDDERRDDLYAHWREAVRRSLDWA